MESQEVNIEDVGLAEEVINREINKVQQLQLMVKVLQTYRYARAQLPALVQEIGDKKRELQGIQDEVTTALSDKGKVSRQVEAEWKVMNDKITSQHKALLQKTSIEAANVQQKLKEEETRLKETEQKYAVVCLEKGGEVADMEAKLNRLKAEYQEITEIVRQKAEAFGTSLKEV